MADDKQEIELMALLQDEKQKSKAFNQVVIKYQQQLYWQIRKMVLSHDDANDVLQNAFIKAWNAIDSFRGESKLSTWLYRIAVNESLTFLSKQRTIHIGDDLEDVMINKLEADSYFDGDELQLKLQKAILTLPEKQRLVFNMKYFDDIKYEEMEAILGTSVGALKASYHLAVKKIEAFFEEEKTL
jgi:RNA polymerase sigma-70 factor (ECF subfamily)